LERALAFSVALCAALLVAASTRHASASELSWEGSPSCDEGDRLTFQVERALGTPLARAGLLQFSVRVEPARATDAASSASIRARLLVVGGLGTKRKERVLVGESCSKLVDTLAIAVALALGAAESEQEEGAEWATPRQASPTPALPPPPNAADEMSTSSAGSEPSGPRASALALIVSDVGSLPAPAFGAALGLELAWSRVQLRLSGTSFLTGHVDRRAVDGSPRGADFSLALGTAHICASLFGDPSAAVFIPLCAGGELGRLAGIGRGVTVSRERAVAWVGALLESGVFWSITGSPLRLGALVAGVVPFNRDDFVLGGIGPMHRPGRAVARAALAVSVSFE
jgi:hypothetical protein